MKISLLIPSRGRPLELLRTITETDRHIAKAKDTRISVALDLDDATNPDLPETTAQLTWHVGEREDSLGAKYNRAARLAPADLYVLGADDNIFTADGWDDQVREQFALFGDGFGFVYFGRLDGTLPTNMAIPHALMERQGFLFPDIWPVWFHDTWIDEIAHMTGRVLWANVPVEEIDGRGKSRGIRDIVHWTAVFDATRPMRQTLSNRLSAEFNQPWVQEQLLQRRNVLEAFFASRMQYLRMNATTFERRMSFDAPEDERYIRIKERSREFLPKVQERAA